MRESGARQLGIVTLLFALTVLLSACEEGDNVIVRPDTENTPPIIVTQGPEFPSGTIELLGSSGTPQPWVLVGDADGLFDISAVFLNIDSIQIHDVIIRPDAMDGGCANVLYAPNNDIDTTSLIPVPVDIAGLTNEPLSRDEGGIYRISPFGIPNLAQAFGAFGQPSGCATGGGYLDWLMLLPPAAASPTNVFLSYLDAEFIGISVSVYDKVGATATTTFPDLRVVYTTQEETTVAP